MHITEKTVSPYVIDALVGLDAQELSGYVARTRDELAKEVTVPGFRKGKAPSDIAGKELDPEAVRQEALEYALQDSFTGASGQKGWDVLKTSDLKLVKNDATGLEYSVRVHLWPPVVLPDLAGVQVPRRPVEITEAEITEALDTIRNMRATFLDKTGPAASGDRVEIDFDSAVGGQPVQGGQSRNHPLIIGGKNFMPGFEEELVGLTAGDAKTFSLTAPADYYEPTLAGKAITFTVMMHRVQVVLKPAADDAFAKALGRFENLSQLLQGLREGIANEKKTKEKQRLRLAVLDGIIAASQVPAPEPMVREELDAMIRRFADDLKGRGLELTMYLARLKKTEDQMREDWLPEAQRQVRISLVLRAVAKEKGITVTADELDAAVRDTIGELIASGQIQEDQVDPERIKSALAERILTDKTLDFIESACVTDGTA